MNLYPLNNLGHFFRFALVDWRHVGAKFRGQKRSVVSSRPTLSLTSASSQIMSRLVWQYEGANVEKHGEQCVFVGDKVHHDILGEGIAVRIDGGMIIIEFLEDGERIEKHQTKGHVYALEQRERAQQKRTGRRPEGQVGLLASFFGKDHEAPVGAEEANIWGTRRAKRSRCRAVTCQ